MSLPLPWEVSAEDHSMKKEENEESSVSAASSGGAASAAGFLLAGLARGTFYSIVCGFSFLFVWYSLGIIFSIRIWNDEKGIHYATNQKEGLSQNWRTDNNIHKTVTTTSKRNVTRRT
jgi:hypothetical protein